MPKSSKTETYINCSDESTLQIVTKFKLEIATFANCSKVELANTSSIPIGCAILPISDKCQVHLLLKVSCVLMWKFFLIIKNTPKIIILCFNQGLIDTSKEVEKLKKKSDLLTQTVEKLNKAMNVADYEIKVPEDVRSANKEKLKQSQDELDRLAEAIGVLKVMDS